MDELKLVAALLQPVQAAMNETIVRQGDLGSELFFIESGQVEVVVHIPGGESATLARMGPGDHFGEMAFVGGSERAADVIALGPVRLWKLARAQFFGSIASLTDLHQRLAREAMLRSRNNEHQTTLVKQGTQNTVHLVLDKIMRAELRSLRSADKSARLSFDQIVEFYTRAKFLYPAKMQELQPRFDRVKATWEGLLQGNNEIFKILCMTKPVDGVVSITNSICAYQYSPACWQIQHLVSADRLGLTGTLQMLLGLADWFRRSNFTGCHRFTYRPDNPGVTQLFSHFCDQLGATKFHSGVFAYLMETLDNVDTALATVSADGVQVEVIHDEAHEDLRAFFTRQLHPVEASALALNHAGWESLSATFGSHGLTRKRSVLAVRDARGQLVGAAICNISSEGMNFSFLENAVEYITVAGELDEFARAQVLAALLISARALMKAAGRDYLACMFDPTLSPLAQKLGLLPEKPKQYAVATYSANVEDMDAIHQASLRYYRELLTRNL